MMFVVADLHQELQSWDFIPSSSSQAPTSNSSGFFQHLYPRCFGRIVQCLFVPFGTLQSYGARLGARPAMFHGWKAESWHSRGLSKVYFSINYRKSSTFFTLYTISIDMEQILNTLCASCLEEWTACHHLIQTNNFKNVFPNWPCKGPLCTTPGTAMAGSSETVSSSATPKTCSTTFFERPRRWPHKEEAEGVEVSSTINKKTEESHTKEHHEANISFQSSDQRIDYLY